MSRAKLYPLTIRESLSKNSGSRTSSFYLQNSTDVTRVEFLRYLENGGMPGIFTIKNKIEKNLLLQDWISLTVDRDVHTFERKIISSELIREILEQIAKLEQPNLNNIAKAIKIDTRRIRSHLEVLETLFVINSLPAHKSGTGKILYFILDCAIASILGASFEKVMWTTVLNELLAKRSYFDNNAKLYYYRNTKGSIVNFLEENTKGDISLLKIITEEKYDERNLEILSAYQKKVTGKVSLYAIAPFESLGSKELVKIYPWEAIA
jgi:predicted AAA+ superfamily ATPase